jgi:drug/metabolite transporter (DMT)-like permease
MTGRTPIYKTLVGRFLLCAALVVIVSSWFWDGDVISLAYIGAMVVIVIGALSFRKAELAKQSPLERAQRRNLTVRTLTAMAISLFAFAIAATAIRSLGAPTAVAAIGATLAGAIPALVVFRSRSGRSASTKA